MHNAQCNWDEDQHHRYCDIVSQTHRYFQFTVCTMQQRPTPHNAQCTMQLGRHQHHQYCDIVAQTHRYFQFTHCTMQRRPTPHNAQCTMQLGQTSTSTTTSAIEYNVKWAQKNVALCVRVEDQHRRQDNSFFQLLLKSFNNFVGGCIFFCLQKT